MDSNERPIGAEVLTVSGQSYINGAKDFKRFIKRPERFKNNVVILRVRMEGRYGGWKLRDAVFTGFGFTPGDTLYLNDLYVLGSDFIDVDMDEWCVDCFAPNKAADWLEENNVTTGTIFEGNFVLHMRRLRRALVLEVC